MRRQGARFPTAVIALGGNALAPPGEEATIASQFRHARESIASIVELAQAGWKLAIVHGNGPQVGDELVRNELSREVVEPMPLGVLVAVTAGWIGYMLQQSLHNELCRAGVARPVVTVMTQTLVDVADPLLQAPSKPIGFALSDEQARVLRDLGVVVGRDGGGRYRRLAPSPVPVGVVEAPVVKQLVDDGVIVIAGGGGGAPVVSRDGLLSGREAVIDKDLVAALLARDLGAEALVILTDVDAVYRGWGTPKAHPLRRLSVAEAEAVLVEEVADEGGMRPKLAAAIDFVRRGGQRAIIAHLNHGPAALKGETGTTIQGNQ